MSSPVGDARLWLLLVVPLTVGCASTSIRDAALPTAGGSVADRAMLSMGEQRYQLAACRSGDLAHFLGVDLEDRQGGAAVRLVIDPIDGPRVRVVHGRGEARQRIDLVPGRCRVFDAWVRPTGWIVDTVRDVSGSIDVECAGDPGPAVDLHARFSHCH